MARYYWLKLHDNFFDKYEIKKLRRYPGGDTYTIIYLKLLVFTINTGGIYKFKGLESHVHKEIALDINEDENAVELTLNALKMLKLLEEKEGDVAFPEHEKVAGAIAPKPSKKALPENKPKMYGTFENVPLSDAQYEKALKFYGSAGLLENRINDMSVYCKAKGKKYKDYGAALIQWGRKDGIKGTAKKEEFKEDNWL